jgi:flavin-dependent trigonelline monooxygenase, reductase component
MCIVQGFCANSLSRKAEMIGRKWTVIANCDNRTFRNVLGSFLTGVTVVATRAPGDEIRAFTANSFASVSLDPPLVLVCLAKTSTSIEAFSKAETFGISILGDWQRDISNAFATRDPEIRATESAKLSDDIAPHVPGSLAVLACDRQDTIDAGDHIILIGKVHKFQSNDGEPLGYLRGGYVGIGPSVREIEMLDAPLKVGGILDVGGNIVLWRNAGSEHWSVPMAAMGAGEKHGAVLDRLFTSLGVSVDATLPYSLFQEAGEKSTTLIFSVESQGAVLPGMLPDQTEIGLFGEEDKPWRFVQGTMMRGLLRRFFYERNHNLFGMYFDTKQGGRVVGLQNKVTTFYSGDQPWFSAGDDE